MVWWVTDPGRARSEQAAVAELAEAGWLGGIRWYVGDGLALTVDFEVAHGAEAFPLTMTYAALHPHAPPRIVPRTAAASPGTNTRTGNCVWSTGRTTGCRRSRVRC